MREAGKGDGITVKVSGEEHEPMLFHSMRVVSLAALKDGLPQIQSAPLNV